MSGVAALNLNRARANSLESMQTPAGDQHNLRSEYQVRAAAYTVLLVANHTCYSHPLPFRGAPYRSACRRSRACSSARYTSDAKLEPGGRAKSRSSAGTAARVSRRRGRASPSVFVAFDSDARWSWGREADGGADGSESGLEGAASNDAGA